MIKQGLIWAGIFVVVLVLVSSLSGGKPSNAQEISYSDFLSRVERNQFQQVIIEDQTLTGLASDGTKVQTLSPRDPDLIKNLREKNVNIKVTKPEEMSPLMQILISWAPWLLIIGIWIYVMRQMQGGGKGGAGGGGPFGFGKARIQVQSESKVKVGFDDVAGVDEAKQELEEVVEFLRDPNKFQKLGGRIPKGVLLVGSPGTGKTLLAKAVAGEAGVPFFSLSGSDFVEMFVGVGAARVRDLFETGKKNAPCIIFIDEIDAVGRHRGAGLGGGNDEREQTLNAMLVEMDGFDASEGVIIIAATNRPDVLDPALLRPGRFDRQVVVPLPDIRGRERILQVHMNKVPLGTDVDVEVIAKGTPGFSGADLENLVNEAALMAARRNKRLVDMHDFETARDKVMMGAERRSTVMTLDQKKTTAYHEAGHAIAMLYLEGPKDPLHKVTIIPRGRALGVTMSLPGEDKFTYDKRYLENQIAMLYGGRLAEEIFLEGQQTSGASNDIERATDLARRMVMQWGMSDLGPINYGEKESQVFLGRDIGSRSHISEAMAGKVDAAVREIIDRNFDRCKKLLTKHKREMELLAQGLLEHETLDAAQVDDLLAGKKVVVRKETAKKAQPKSQEVVEDAIDDGQIQTKVKVGSKLKDVAKSAVKKPKK
ncbi:MAG: ATP-dependent metallopeptidase FtsH/Yme1/Tma family protein [Blastochloris viridis]|uniref:ATP-dependent zinc metalloprotease FtsH n=1 Tax=Blastochloris viridis TaxID=1079 RepID=A0A6N4RFH6_BLAVI|nr:MAG: ATP-dependent metallopeptidase FtsH/Yme1/Tma family protein [Blastochloris viridis]